MQRISSVPVETLNPDELCRMYSLIANTTEHLFNLKFAAKELARNAKKCEKDEKTEKLKVKKVSLALLSVKINSNVC